MKLTKASVERLSATHADVIYWDKMFLGFGVRVKASGIKSYVIQYRTRETGRSRRKTLGQHGPLLSFNHAKELAKGYLSDVVRGNDPVAMANATRDAPTVKDLADNYLSKHAIPKKRPKSIQEDQSMLTRLILPKLGNLKAAEVAYEDIQSLHNGLRKIPYRGNRVLSLLSKMFARSIRWDGVLIIPFVELKNIKRRKDIAGYQIQNCRS